MTKPSDVMALLVFVDKKGKVHHRLGTLQMIDIYKTGRESSEFYTLRFDNPTTRKPRKKGHRHER